MWGDAVKKLFISQPMRGKTNEEIIKVSNKATEDKIKLFPNDCQDLVEAIQAEINALKSLLRDTDYKANKLIEGLVATMNGATAVNFISRFIAWLADAMREYGDVVSSRAAWREKINALEAELETLTDE